MSGEGSTWAILPDCRNALRSMLQSLTGSQLSRTSRETSDLSPIHTPDSNHPPNTPIAIPDKDFNSMTRHNSLLGSAAIAVMIALGLPSLTGVASAGTEPPTTEPGNSGDLAANQQSAEPVSPTEDPDAAPADTEATPPPPEPDTTEPVTTEPVTTEPPTTASVGEPTVEAPVETDVPTTEVPASDVPTTEPPVTGFANEGPTTEVPATEPSVVVAEQQAGDLTSEPAAMTVSAPTVPSAPRALRGPTMSMTRSICLSGCLRCPTAVCR